MILHNKKIRLPFELAELLKRKTNFSTDDMENWYHHIYMQGWRVREDAYERFGGQTDDGFYELTKDGGGNLNWEDVYTNDWAISDGYYPMPGQDYVLCPTIYEVQTYLLKKHKFQITVYSRSQESWQYRITTPGMHLEEGLYGEDFPEPEDALLAAIKEVLNSL